MTDSGDEKQNENGMRQGEKAEKTKHELRKEKKLLSAEHRKHEGEKTKKVRQRKSIFMYGSIVVIFAGIVFAISLLPAQDFTAQAQGNEDIPPFPIHWHPNLKIEINGRMEVIPSNIGISGGIHEPLHTHASDGVMHYEVSNPTPENMPLSNFFRIWRKQFNSNCIFDYCNGEDGVVRMFVNGEENKDFENYIPKDDDEILITFSSEEPDATEQ